MKSKMICLPLITLTKQELDLRKAIYEKCESKPKSSYNYNKL